MSSAPRTHMDVGNADRPSLDTAVELPTDAYCATFNTDRLTVRQYGFYKTNPSRGYGRILVTLHGMFDEKTGTLGISCTPLFPVVVGARVNWNGWDDVKNREKAFNTVDAAFSELRGEQSLQIGLANSTATKIKSGSTHAFLKFCNRRTSDHKTNTFSLENADYSFTFADGKSHPSRWDGEGPYDLQDVISGNPKRIIDKLSASETAGFDDSLKTCLNSLDIPPDIPNLVIGNTDIWATVSDETEAL